jgi:hypothetical protein
MPGAGTPAAPATKEGSMTKTATTTAALCVLALGLASAGIARAASRSPSGGASYSRLYDPKTVETVSGEVVLVEQTKATKRMGRGVHLILKTDKETIPVHLGPAWYVERQQPAIAPKDHVEVKGSRVTFEGKPAIIAAEVRKGDETLVLRDDAGVPAWAHRGGMAPMMGEMMKQSRAHCDVAAVERTTKMIEDAKQSNDPEKMRAALDAAQKQLGAHDQMCRSMMERMHAGTGPAHEPTAGAR